jgi:hypothetical protein
MRGSNPSRENRFFCKTSRMAVGPTQSPVQWTSVSFPEGKAVGS